MLTPSELYIALRECLKFTGSETEIPEVNRPYYMHGKGDLGKDFFVSAPCNDADLGSENFRRAGNLDVTSALDEMFSNDLLQEKLEQQHGVNVIIPMVECRTYGIERSHYVFLSIGINNRKCDLTLYDPKQTVTRMAYDVAPVIQEGATTAMHHIGETFKQVGAYFKNETYSPTALEGQKYVSPMEKIEDYFKRKGFEAKFQKKCLGVQAITDNYSCGNFVYNYICSLVLSSRLPESLSLEEAHSTYSMPSKPLKENIPRGKSFDEFVDEDGDVIDEKSTKWQTRIAQEGLQRAASKSPDFT